MRAGYSTRVPKPGTSKVCQARDDGLARNAACPSTRRSKAISKHGRRYSGRICHLDGRLQGNTIGQVLFLAASDARELFLGLL
jgi:hypothetical protein